MRKLQRKRHQYDRKRSWMERFAEAMIIADCFGEGALDESWMLSYFWAQNDAEADRLSEGERHQVDD